jgi:hypothetical protein
MRAFLHDEWATTSLYDQCFHREALQSPLAALPLSRVKWPCMGLGKIDTGEYCMPFAPERIVSYTGLARQGRPGTQQDCLGPPPGV